MKIYTVTYCTMNKKLNANIFYHACFFISEYDESTKKLKVIDNYGFYGLPLTQENAWQQKMGFNFDFENHGMFCKEEIRYLASGRPLHGVTFELTESQFEALRNKCKKMISDQENAIQEIVEPLKLPKKLGQEKTRIYPYEHLSQQIFALEKIKATEEKREPRLQPFKIKISMTLWGPSLNTSSTCKSQALKLLDGILTKKQIDRLTENGAHLAIPRYSGKLEKIFLHSEGPLSIHQKKSGEKIYFHDGKNEKVNLYWSMPPQEIETLSTSTDNALHISKKHQDDIKDVISKMQQLEWFFINSALPVQYEKSLQKLIHLIKQHYECFSKIEPKKPCTKTEASFMEAIISFFSMPVNEEEKLANDVKKAKHLINSLYMAMIDNWELEESSASAESKEASKIAASEEPLEALVTLLSVEQKKKLCEIIGRTYCQFSEETTIDQKIS